MHVHSWKASRHVTSRGRPGLVYSECTPLPQCRWQQVVLSVTPVRGGLLKIARCYIQLAGKIPAVITHCCAIQTWRGAYGTVNG